MKTEKSLDLESQKNLLRGINSILKKQVEESKIENKVLHKIVNKNSSTKIDKKTILTIMILSLSFAIFNAANGAFNVQDSNETLLPTGKYLIQNLRGDTINTWVSWHLVEGEQLTVNILNSDSFPSDKIDAIKNTILSEQTVEVDDSLLNKGPAGTTSTYYMGWQGALQEISKEQTKYYIPTSFKIIESPQGAGDITIMLTTLKDGDGYSGYTKSITDENQILKSSITIYDMDNLTAEQIATITRHELGHALGLAHSTAIEDLMAPVIRTPYPFISDCDIDAIAAVYDGKKSSEVVCEK